MIRFLILVLVTLTVSTSRIASAADVPQRPNFVVIFCDDLGWGDLSCFTQDSYVPGSNKATEHDPPLLYDLEIDLGESRDLASSHAEVVDEIGHLKKRHETKMQFTDSQLDRKP